MALVAYDNSDVSDSDTEESSESPTKIQPAVVVGSKGEVEPNIDSTSEVKSNSVSRGSSLFASLPAPICRGSSVTAAEEDDDFLQVKSSISASIARQSNSPKDGKPVKITIPALSELPEEETPSAAKRLQSSGSGLLSILPEPKQLAVKANSRPLIPYSLSKQKKTQAVTSGLPAKDSQKSSITPISDSIKNHEESDEDNEEQRKASFDFFSLTESGQSSQVDGDLKTDDPLVNFSPTMPATSSWPNADQHSVLSELPILSSSSGLPLSSTDTVQSMNYQASSSGQASSEDNGSLPNTNSITSLFTDEGFMRLHGRKRRGDDDIQIIDVSQDDQLPKPEEWLNRVLSEEAEYQPSRKKGYMPSAQHRRKHQITYLAFQAKQREIELKNQWAENRMTRRQTQAKYGF